MSAIAEQKPAAKKVRKKKFGLRRFGIFDILVILLFLILDFIMIYPFWNVLVTSFSTAGEVMSKIVIFWPDTFNLKAYEFILSSNQIPRAFLITVASTACGTVWVMLLSTTVSYALSKRYLIGRNFLILIITLTMFLDGGLIPFYLLVSRTLKLTNTFWVLFITGGFGVGTFVMLKAFFVNTIPDSLEESARIDGANDLYIFARIIIPLSGPAIATFSLFTAVGLWNQYFTPMIFNSSKPDLYTLQLVLRKIIVEQKTKEFGLEMLRKYGSQSVYEEGMKYAAVMVATGPILLVYPFVQKYFAKGLMLGSVKG